MSERQTRWHYAVHKRGYYYTLACRDPKDIVSTPDVQHGITINRGDVNCEDCMRMMGMV